MNRRLPKEIKDEILVKVKEGQKVIELASTYGISEKTIYSWLRKQIKPDISMMEYRKLKSENKELKRILGMVMLELERKKKARAHT